MTPHAFYEAQLGILTLLEQKLTRQKKRITWLRLICFSLAVVFGYFGFIESIYPSLFIGASIVSIFIFLFWVKRSVAINYQYNIVQSKLKINHWEILALQRKRTEFDDGANFEDESNYTKDLDVFGDRSLFQLINRTFTTRGAQRLADYLSRPLLTATEIEERQQSILAVEDQVEWRQTFLAHGMQVESESINNSKIKNVASISLTEDSSTIVYTRWLPLGISILAIILFLLFQKINFLWIGFLCNLGITLLFLRKTQQVIQRTESQLKRLSALLPAAQSIQNQSIQSKEWHQWLKLLQSGSKELLSLKKLLDLLESRNNIIVGTMLNGVVGFDLHMVYRIQNWDRKNHVLMDQWLDVMAEIEVVFSLANFGWNNPTYTFPEVKEDPLEIKASHLRHPFLTEDQNVGNPLTLGGDFKLMLITGSNMSGKSTFLRSIGVNQILAMAGSKVAAKNMVTRILPIFTSFRKSDSLQEHTSLFYDELKRLKQIVEAVQNSQSPLSLVLLDEILRGTNSEDKYYGSKKYLEKLSKLPVWGVLATHDLDLAQMEAEHGPTIQNYSFESQIINEELIFDYQLKKGIAKNKNATFLMKKMGIIDGD